MRILSIGLFLLFGGCSSSPDSSSSPENFGGDINSATGRAWLANLEVPFSLKSIKRGNGVDLWVKGDTHLALNPNGDIESFYGEDLDGLFVGAPSATIAFYWAPEVEDFGVIAQEARTKLEGFFISNVTKNNVTQRFIYLAALKFSEAELAAKRVRHGIIGTVDMATLAQKRAYYADVHKPSNFDFTKPVITGMGELAEAQPQAIIID